MDKSDLPTEEVVLYRISALEDEVYRLRKRMRYLFWAVVVGGIEMLPVSFETILDILSR